MNASTSIKMVPNNKAIGSKNINIEKTKTPNPK